MRYDSVPLHDTATGPTQRIWARYSSTRPLPRRLAVAGTYAPLEAWILDLSAGGVGLLVGEPQKVGVLLHVELETCPEAAPLKLLANVIHCEPVGQDGNEFRIGCKFVTPLSECDLQILLQ
jgi:hypothetical protein